MSKLRSIAFSAFAATALAVGVWAYLHVKHNKAPAADPLQALPADAICVIQTNSFRELVNRLTHQNLIWQALGNDEPVNDLAADLRYFDSLLSISDEVSALITDNALYHALYKKENATEQLLVFALKDHADEGMVSAFFDTHFKKAADLSQTVYNVPVSKGRDWHIASQGDLVFLSSDLGLLQRSTHLDKKSSLALDTGYTAMKSLDNDRFCKIYLANHSGIFSRELLGGSSILNMEVNPNSVNFTGYNKPGPSSALYSLLRQKPGSVGCLAYLPEKTICFTTQLVSDAELFFEAKAPTSFSKQWKIINDSALYNIRQELEENLSGEFTRLSYAGEAQQKEDLFLFSVNDDSKCDNLLGLAADSVSTVKINAEDVKIVKLKAIYANIFGATPANAGAAFAYDGYMFVFGSFNEALAHARRLNANEVLSKDPGFMAFAGQNLVQENNFIYYEDPAPALSYGITGLIGNSDLHARQDQLSHICFTALNAKDAMLVRINIEYKQTPSMDAGQSYLWVFSADTGIQTPAYPFKNHATGENELVFQDAANVLYLANATGSLLWKKKINEPVRSKIYTVDIFRNKKYQLFFSTDNYLHLVDRNGNYVQGYPVRLPAKATSPVVSYDYEGNGDVRLLLACADRRIYNYTLYGIRNDGYTPFRTEAEVDLPVQYIRVGGSDYLVAVDRNGKIYAFSRKGEGRVSLRNNAAPGLRSFYVEAGNSIQSTKLVYVDHAHNALCKISLDDKKETIKLDNAVTGYSAVYAPFNNGKQADVILYGSGGMVAYDLFGSKLVESFSAAAVYGDITNYDGPDENVLLAWDQSGRKIDVLSYQGALLRSMTGCTQKPLPFNLFGDNKHYLLIVDGSKLKCAR